MPPGFENRQVLPALWVRLPPSSPKNIRNVFPDFRLSVRSGLMKKCENSCSGKICSSVIMVVGLLGKQVFQNWNWRFESSLLRHMAP